MSHLKCLNYQHMNNACNIKSPNCTRLPIPHLLLTSAGGKVEKGETVTLTKPMGQEVHHGAFQTLRLATVKSGENPPLHTAASDSLSDPVSSGHTCCRLCRAGLGHCQTWHLISLLAAEQAWTKSLSLADRSGFRLLQACHRRADIMVFSGTLL